MTRTVPALMVMVMVMALVPGACRSPGPDGDVGFEGPIASGSVGDHDWELRTDIEERGLCLYLNGAGDCFDGVPGPEHDPSGSLFERSGPADGDAEGGVGDGGYQCAFGAVPDGTDAVTVRFVDGGTSAATVIEGGDWDVEFWVLCTEPGPAAEGIEIG